LPLAFEHSHQEVAGGRIAEPLDQQGQRAKVAGDDVILMARERPQRLERDLPLP
jgi:hypothetical protein